MSPILIALACLCLLLGGSGLIVFVQAARRTNEDWEQCPASRQLDVALQRSEDQTNSEPQPGMASRIRQA